VNAGAAGGGVAQASARHGWRALVPWRSLALYGVLVPVGLLGSWSVLWWLLFGRAGVGLPPPAAMDWLFEVVMLCPLVGLGITAHSQLRMNTPTVARLVPDHPRSLRLALLATVAVTLGAVLALVALCAAWRGAWLTPGALAGQLARHLLVSAVVLATARMDQGWLVSVPLALALLAPGRWISGLKPWWPWLEGVAAWPAFVASVGLVLAAVVAVVGTGDAAHRRAHVRRAPQDEAKASGDASRAAAGGPASGWRATWDRAWARWFGAHVTAQSRRDADPGTRALIALGPRLHGSAVWRGALWWLALVALQAVIVWNRQDGGAPDAALATHDRLAQAAHRFTLLLGLAVAFAVVSTRMLMTMLAAQTVAEQRLMSLTPGVPRGRTLRRHLLGRAVSRTVLWVAVYYGAHAWMQSGRTPLSWGHLDPVLLAAVCLPLWPLLVHDASSPPTDAQWFAWVRPLLVPVLWMAVLMVHLAGAGIDRGTVIAAGAGLSLLTFAWGVRRWRQLPEPWPAGRRGDARSA
jgi:hypothetical protein